MSKSKGFIAEFKEFISKGNAMELAVGMVIGAAFTSIVNSIVNDLIMPVVGLILGGIDFTDLYWRVPNFFGQNTAAVIRYGNLIQQIVNFLIVAFALFVVIKAINKMNERARVAAEKAAEKLGKADDAKNTKNADKTAKAVEEAAKAEKKSDAEMVALLKEIRDELKKSKK